MTTPPVTVHAASPNVNRRHGDGGSSGGAGERRPAPCPPVRILPSRYRLRNNHEQRMAISYAYKSYLDIQPRDGRCCFWAIDTVVYEQCLGRHLCTQPTRRFTTVSHERHNETPATHVQEILLRKAIRTRVTPYSGFAVL